MQCAPPCKQPHHVVGYCCPVCYLSSMTERTNNVSGQRHHDCTRCSRVERGQSVHCYRTACPVLDCAPSSQYRPRGSCCRQCIQTRLEPVQSSPVTSCSFRSILYKHQQSFRPDHCTMCQCQDWGILCKRFVCPPVRCPAQRLYYRHGFCCPFCRDRDPLSCTYTIDHTHHSYKHGATWSPNLCMNCTCYNGETKCTTEKCPHPNGCPRGHRQRKLPGKCCHICEQKEATCTVFGDPHYQTFDGYAYTFQGTCRYVLTQECTLRGDQPRFVVVAHNGPWGKAKASWTKHITIRLLPFSFTKALRVSLLPNKRVKEQGRLLRLPHVRLRSPMYRARLDQYGNVLVTVTGLGLKVLWDGHSYAQVTLHRKHANRVCGLCGNYNRLIEDDTVPRYGSEAAASDRHFGQSWIWGSVSKCRSIRDRIYHRRQRRRRERRLWRAVSPRPGSCRLIISRLFASCHALLSPAQYFTRCVEDRRACASNDHCYCQSLRAYISQCKKRGLPEKAMPTAPPQCLNEKDVCPARNRFEDLLNMYVSQDVSVVDQ